MPQRVTSTTGPLGSVLGAAGILKTMPESTLTQAIYFSDERGRLTGLGFTPAAAPLVEGCEEGSGGADCF